MKGDRKRKQKSCFKRGNTRWKEYLARRRERIRNAPPVKVNPPSKWKRNANEESENEEFITRQLRNNPKKINLEEGGFTSENPDDLLTFKQKIWLKGGSNDDGGVSDCSGAIDIQFDDDNHGPDEQGCEENR